MQKKIYNSLRVSGVKNTDQCTWECINQSTSLLNDTNPTKSTKVHLVTSDKMSNITTLNGNNDYDTIHNNNRENWWIELRIMWRRARTLLRMQRRKFIRLPCMRRKRGRSDKNMQNNFFFIILSLSLSFTHSLTQLPDPSLIPLNSLLYSFDNTCSNQFRENEKRFFSFFLFSSFKSINHHVHDK